MLKLIIQDDEGHQTVVPFVRQDITIGRQPGNTIRLTERNVSRHHARLLRENGAVLLEDLSSSNGTKVNGEKLQGQIALRAGDQIRIGDYELSLRSEEVLTEAPAAGGIPRSPEAPLTAQPIAERLEPPAEARSPNNRKTVSVVLAISTVLVAIAADRIFMNARPPGEREAAQTEMAPAPSEPSAREAFATQTPPAQAGLSSSATAATETTAVAPREDSAVAPPATAAPAPAEVRPTKDVAKKNREGKEARVATTARTRLDAAILEEAKRLYQEGTDLLRRNELSDAVTALNRCLQLDPALAKCHRMLGATYARLRDPEQGAVHYRKFIQLAPDDPEAAKVRILLEQYEATRGLSKKD